MYLVLRCLNLAKCVHVHVHVGPINNVRASARKQKAKRSYACGLIIPPYPSNRELREVVSEAVDVKVNKGKTETVQLTVEGAIFSEFPGTKVRALPLSEPYPTK